MNTKHSRPYYGSRIIKKKFVPTINNTGFFQLGLMIPFLYLLGILILTGYERGFFTALGINKELIQIEIGNRIFPIFFIISNSFCFLLFLNFLHIVFRFIKEKRRMLKYLGFILLFLSPFLLFDSFIKHLMNADIFFAMFVLAIGINVYGYNVNNSISEREWYVYFVVIKISQLSWQWIGGTMIFSSIAFILAFGSGHITGKQLKNEVISNKYKTLLRNYEKYSIYAEIDSCLGVERTRLFIIESKNDTITVVK